MSVTVRLPSQLRVLVGGSAEVVVEATNVREAIAAVEDENDALAGVLKNNIDFNAVTEWEVLGINDSCFRIVVVHRIGHF
jgi:molybdopterin converting factor small subunit